MSGILVIGETCRDVFVYCDSNRLCPEAPVPADIGNCVRILAQAPVPPPEPPGPASRPSIAFPSDDEPKPPPSEVIGDGVPKTEFEPLLPNEFVAGDAKLVPPAPPPPTVTG